MILKGYLVLYNLLQLLGWSVILVRLVRCAAGGGDSLLTDLYPAVDGLVRCLQTATLLEVLHAATGLVRSSPVVTAMQIASRITVLWTVLYMLPEVQTCLGFPMLLVAWTVTELVRYSFYSLNLLQISLPILTWLRYSLFVVLYLVGVAGELICYYVSLPHIADRRLLSIELPNKWNFSFDFYYAVVAMMALYVPFFPKLYLHMLSQRKKVLAARSQHSKGN